MVVWIEPLKMCGGYFPMHVHMRIPSANTPLKLGTVFVFNLSVENEQDRGSVTNLNVQAV